MTSKSLPKRFILMLVCALTFLLSLIFHENIVGCVSQLPIFSRFFRTSVKAQVEKYGPAARARLITKFEEKALHYPPDKVEFVAIKSTKKLLVYAAEIDGPFKYVTTYPILGASGHLGPKLRWGDLQVPEGIYELSLEPNTPYHLALRLNYPNNSDLVRARADGRNNPGSDILIHGTKGSVGCIAMGDPASEDLFVLVHDTETKTARLIVSPIDFRSTKDMKSEPTDPSWLPDLYQEIQKSMVDLPLSQSQK